jgi:hypothetical protein
MEDFEKADFTHPFYCAKAISFGKATGASRERIEDLVRRAARSPIHTYRAFLAGAEYYLPRWGGKPGELEAYALRVMELSKDYYGAEAYPQVVMTVSTYHGDSVLKDFEFSWPLIEQGFLDLQKRIKNYGFTAYQFSRLATYARNREKARVLFEYLGDDGYQFWRSDLYDQQRAWALRDPAEVNKTLFEFQQWTGPIIWSPDGNGLIFSDYDGVHQIDLKAGQTRLAVPVDRLTWFDQSADGRHLVLATNDGAAQLVDLNTGRSEQLYRSADNTGLTSVRFATDGRAVARDKKGKLLTWKIDPANNHDQKEFLIPGGYPMAHEALTADGALVLKPRGAEGLALWDTTTGTLKQEWKLPKPPPKNPPPAPLPYTYIPGCTVLSADGKLALVGYRGKLQVWNVGDAAPQASAEFGDGGITHAAFTADGKHLITAMWRIKESIVDDKPKYDESKSEIILWNVDDLSIVKKYAGHDASVSYIAIAPDGKRFASSSHDETVRIWALPE